MDIRSYEFDDLGIPIVGAAVTVYTATLTHPPVTVETSGVTNGSGLWSFTGLAENTKDVKIVANGQTKWYKGKTQHSLGTVFFETAPKFLQIATPAVPGATTSFLYFKADGLPYYRSGAAGVETRIVDTTYARERLTAARTYYVRSDGSDANTGLADSAGGAFLTWQRAVDVAATLDFGGFTVTLQHGSNGATTFTQRVTVPHLTGGGLLVISGMNNTGGTFFNVTGGNAWTLNNTVTAVQFTNVKLQSTGDTGTIQPTEVSKLAIASGVIFGTCSNAHIWVHDRQAMLYILGTTYTIAGGGNYHIFINGGMAFIESATVTITGTPTFVTFLNVYNGGAVQSPNNVTYSGACNGQRYSATMNGAINTFSGGANYFPGSSAGATGTGGQYS